MKYIDIHAHINFPDYDADRAEVIKRAAELGVAMINIGTSVESSRNILEIAEIYKGIHPHIYAIPGIHPSRVTEYYETLNSDSATASENIFEKISIKIDEDLKMLDELAGKPKVVGIGECGIDIFRVAAELKAPILELQKKLFIGQIEIARKHNIPLMIHARESYSEILSIFDENFISKGLELRGNVHFFAGTQEEAKAFLDRGFTVSFTGVITFADSYAEVVRSVPTDRIMSETDCPFVTPVPYRGKRNEPAYVIEVVKKLAEIKEMEPETMANILISNAERVFSLNLKAGLE